MAHLANIVPSCNTFDPRGFLTGCDVASNELGLIVTFHCPKTIQFGERKVHIPVKLWKYENHICELQSEELNEEWSSQLYTHLLLLQNQHFSSFHNCKSCVYSCDDHPSFNSSLSSSHVWFSYIHNFIIIFSCVYNEPIQQPAPSWLVSFIGRALHRYRRGQGSNPIQAWIFFRLSLCNCKSCVFQTCHCVKSHYITAWFAQFLHPLFSTLFLLPGSQCGTPLTKHRLVSKFRRLLATAGVTGHAVLTEIIRTTELLLVLDCCLSYFTSH